jgi:hypothetical protein
MWTHEMPAGPPRESTEKFYSTVTPKLVKEWTSLSTKGKNKEYRQFFERLLEDYRLWTEWKDAHHTRPLVTNFDSSHVQQSELLS